MQRTGTTSVGEFFNQLGYRVATYKTSSSNKWTWKWNSGNFEAIFNSRDFKKNQIFEDDPWWCSEFYKVLYHRFPSSKFILFTRDTEKWFNSMLSHSDGKNPGNTILHSKVYRRENDLYRYSINNPNKKIEEYKYDNLLDLNEKKEHYIKEYERFNREVKEFFFKNNSSNLFIANLEDKDKWQKLANFMNIKIPKNFEVHANKTIKS